MNKISWGYVYSANYTSREDAEKELRRGGFSDTFRGHFNDIIKAAFDCTIDYIQMHYTLNTRDDTQYWCDCRANENIA